MKKIILSLVVIAALSTACKRNHSCVCTVVDGSITTTGTSEIDDTKSNAAATCASYTVAVNGGTETCVIK